MATSTSRHMAPMTIKWVFVHVAIAVTAMFVIAAAIIAVAATIENLQFARALGQVLNVAVTARNYAEMQPAFAQQANEDLLAMLTRAGRLTADSDTTGARLINSWNGDVRATITSPSVLKITTVVPSRTCRRLTTVLSKTKDLGIRRIETENPGSPVVTLFDQNDVSLTKETTIDSACNFSPMTVVALTLNLR